MNNFTLDLTLKEYRNLLIHDLNYQDYCKKIFSALENSTNKKELGVQKQTMHFTMALLLGGTGNANGSAKHVYATKIYKKKITSWTRSAGKFIHPSEKDSAADIKSDEQAKLKNLSDDFKIHETINWLAAGNLVTITDEQISAIRKMINILLTKETIDNILLEELNTDMQDIKTKLITLITEGGCRQIIFTGAPGTGKTYIAKCIANEIGTALDTTNSLLKYKFVQFHPSYDYTDFVEGLRPIEKDGAITFAKIDGIFKSFCRKVINSKKDTLHFFIIDEINRANLSKVFGELMYGLEKDKRGEKNRFDTKYQNLPTYNFDNMAYVPKADDCFKDGFYIPENIVIIGTMNDIDRSVDSMDFALRRRFEWKEFIVDKNMLITAFNSGSFGTIVKDNSTVLAERIIELNKCINNNGKEYGLNRHYDISQGQAANIPNTCTSFDNLLNYMWEYRIESLLREYLRGEDDIESFISSCKNAFRSSKTSLNDTVQS